MPVPLHLWTIGHSNHSTERFLELLRDHRIEAVADVRSQPNTASDYVGHFRQIPLRQSLSTEGLRYVFLGDQLGGRPPETHMYDGDGKVLYGKLAESQRFGHGMRRLIDGATRHHVAIMCSEEDPTCCHRRLLITWSLHGGPPWRREAAGVSPWASLTGSAPVRVSHIRKDGSSVDVLELDRDTPPAVQPTLFGDEPVWRSVPSVLRSTAQRASSAS